MPNTTTILIVDDQPTNVRVLFDALEQASYIVRAVNSGEAAIASVRHSCPDLILLDVMMPGLDGFETCRRLKADPRTKDVPIIFVTALAESIDEVEGLAIGAVDYITKPIRVEIALARIRTHLTVSKLQHALQQQNEELDAYARMVAHDLKNPLTAILSGAQLLGSSPKIQESNEFTAYVDIIYNASRHAVVTIDSLLMMASVRRAYILHEPLNMKIILGQVMLQLSSMVEQHQGIIELPEEWPVASGHAPWIVQVWMNYISNGLKYGGNPPRLMLGADRYRDTIRFWVQDNGTGLLPNDRAKLFKEGVRLHAPRNDSHGLGLALVRTIIEKLGGEVGVESVLGTGSRFYFTLPAV